MLFWSSDRPSPSRGTDLRFLVPASLLLLAYGAAQIGFGERVSAGNGMGWDGWFYLPVVRDLPTAVFSDGLDAYRLQRVLPPAIVHVALRVLRVSPAPGHVVTAYAVLNLLLLFGTLLLWNDIARRRNVGERGRWLGFVLLFLSFAGSRMPFYLPVSTDASAVFLGALLLDLHLRANGPGMLATLLAGAFTWPSFLVMGAPLYLFAPRSGAGGAEALPRGRAWLAGGTIGLVFLGSLWPFLPRLDLASEVAPVAQGALPLSLALVLAYLVVGFRYLLDDAALFRWTTYKEALRPPRVALLLVLAVGVHAVVGALAVGQSPSDLSHFRRHLAIQPLMRPALFMVAHAVYFGVLPLLLVLRWRAACRAAHRLSLGFTLFIAGIVALGVITESRQLSNGLVALVLVAVLAVEGLQWPAWGSMVVGAIAFIASKVWFGINHEGFLGRSSFLSYPSQYYFMHLGPWMAPETYRLNALASMAALLALALVLRRARTREAEESALPVRPPLIVVRLAAAAGVATLVVAFLEGAARWRLTHEREGAAHGDGSRSHPRLGWANAPGSQVRVRGSGFDVRVRFNSAGMRGPDRDSARTPGMARVLLLGDDFTEGYTVTDEETVGAVLENRLAAAGCRAEVWNAGTAGYGLDQEYLYFVQEGRQYRPDAVVLFFYSDDLAHAVAGRRGKPYLEMRDGRLVERAQRRLPRERLRHREIRRVSLLPWRGSALLRLLSNATLDWPPRARSLLEAVGAVEPPSAPFEIWPYAIAAELKYMWSLPEALLSALDAAVRADGAVLTAVYVPAHFEVDDEAWARMQTRYSLNPKVWDRDKVRRRFQATASGHGIDVVDPSDALRRSTVPAYLPAEGLWTAQGHRITAEQVAAHLLRGPVCAPPAARSAAVIAAETSSPPLRSSR